MTYTEKLYQVMLAQLSQIPTQYLPQISDYLKGFSKAVRSKEENRQEILKLAGSWNDMSEEDFQDYRQETKRTKI